MNGGTVDMHRSVSAHERRALVTIEAVERLVVKAYHLLDAEEVSEADREMAMGLLESATRLTTNRSCTAVKSQSLSDEISASARTAVRLVVEDMERRVAPLREHPERTTP